MKSYTARRNLFGSLANNTSASGLALGDQMMNDSDKYLIQKFNFDERSATTPTVANQQFYNFPYNYKKLIDVSVTVGTTTYTPRLIPSREQWDRLNIATTVKSTIPNYYFVFNNQVGFFPIPSASANTINFNYKIRSRELSQPDYTTGTITITNGSTTVTGSGTTFIADMANRWLQVTAPSGDNHWYQIASFTSTTVLVLAAAYNGTTVSGANYTIGEMSIIPEDFQDLSVYDAVRKYYSSRVKDVEIYQMYQTLYNERYAMMNEQLGSKETSPVLDYGDNYRPQNPNLYLTL